MDFRDFDAFYSDPHFAHANIIGYCERPFYSVQHQEEELIARYNALITSDMKVLFTGDLFLPRERALEIMGRLNGRKFLVAGNHDKRYTDTKLLSWGFEFVERHFIRGTLDGTQVNVCHFPYSGFSTDLRYENLRPSREPGVVLIHGHIHSKDRVTHANTVHVGVDAWDFGPAPMNEVSKLVKECVARLEQTNEVP